MAQNRYATIPESEQQSSSRFKTFVNKNKLPAVILSCIVLFIILLGGLATWLPDIKHITKQTIIEAPIAPGISSKSLKDGLLQCQKISKQNSQSTWAYRSSNPRAPQDIQPVLLKNTVVWDGEGNVLEHVDVLLSNGVISEIKHGIKVDQNLTKIIDVGGHIVSPGIVDMHTHLGVMSWPSLAGTSDTNEMTQPNVPFVRVIDAFNPSDKAIRIVASGGITTALVLPGSSNLIGGEAYAFKLRPVNTQSNQDMLVQTGIDENAEKKWRYMKMACGENPKNNYGRRQNRMPSTRMGEAYLFRQAFADAQKLIRAQDDWCSAAENLSVDTNEPRLQTPFPEDIKLESLSALLRGQVKLNIHCYETHDIEAMLRHAKEFGFEISAVHHALEAYRIPDVLKRANYNITVATFADHWGFKKEAYGASTKAPRLLFEAGIPVALKSDHPVLNSQHMAFEAAKAAHYGLPEQEAFKAITSIPAKALGLDHRVGSLKVGHDADVVIWDRNPLALGALPLQVFIDGLPQFDQRPIEPILSTKKFNKPSLNLQHLQHIKLRKKGNYLLKNIGRNLLNPNATESFVVIKEGLVCPSLNTDDYNLSLKNNMYDSFEIIDIQGGYILPGIIAVGSKLGLVEIPSEGSTGDGIVPSSYSKSPRDIVEAADGLKLGTKKLKEAYKGGVLTTISAPISNHIVIGISTAFKTNAELILTQGTLISRNAALHLQIGDSVKSSQFPTVSSQIAFLRNIFREHMHTDNWYGKAARGDIPTIIMVNNKDEIASVIHLKETVIPKARLAIMGGAEAHLLAPHLAKANIAVVLRPHLCTPEKFDSLYCLTGAPLTNGTAAHVLYQHGVKIGLGVSNDGWARNLVWDAGWLAATSTKKQSISELDAVQFITTNLQEIFGLQKQPSLSQESFVVWSGSPLDMQSKPVLAYDKESGLQLI
ncbi:uncharacterized protein B0P05DRAFT_633363 [Gilbertella persicaria]|uniref:uncharacterized protein n=1 Tax=Gilbertella persicaria TaxID=101096 RepID=UPI0022211D97|nr:uncharacterized protein B0P05DRAFT_633363 [Gilbertella persicaria]KAI8098293.1 hypothetical protein B0P05DRAFT_633363 [Gilbertella persicaria]